MLNCRLALANDDSSKPQPELQEEKAKDAFGIFSENLRHPNKCIRLMTLRILCHFETFSTDSSSEEHPPKKKMKTEETKKPLHKRNVSRFHILCSVLYSCRLCTQSCYRWFLKIFFRTTRFLSYYAQSKRLFPQ